MRMTKIVATIGPASDDKRTLQSMISSGMDIARQNFSHGDHEKHDKPLSRLRSLSGEIGIMMDTQGPEIRLGDVEEGTVLKRDDKIELTEDDVVGNADELPVDYPKLLDYVEPGDNLLIDDGQLEIEVDTVEDNITGTVIYGGPILSKKSLNIPGKDVGLITPTEKDIRDIKFSIERDFDFVSLSFVKSPEDIERVRKLLDNNNSDMEIIAKIEHVKAIDNLEEILEKADGAMIARGDLGVEVPSSDIPVLQKEIIQKCNSLEKPVITATQMLKSMTENPRATRAEVSDVANSVIDGTDSVMLSEETAVGKYPVKSIELMSEVVQKAEKYLLRRIHHTLDIESKETADMISKNVWQAAREIDAKYIVAHTSSGYTAKKIAKFRPDIPVIVFTDSKKVQRQLNIVWGVKPFYTKFPEHSDEMMIESAEFLYDENFVEKEDKLILTAGVPTPVSGITNMMEIRTVESLLDEKKRK